MNKKFFKNENGDTNVVSMVIILTVVVVLAFLFKNYIADLFSMIFS